MKLYTKQLSNNSNFSTATNTMPTSFLVLFVHMLSFQKTYINFITGSLEVFAYNHSKRKVAQVSYVLNGLQMNKQAEEGSILLFGEKI